MKTIYIRPYIDGQKPLNFANFAVFGDRWGLSTFFWFYGDFCWVKKTVKKSSFGGIWLKGVKNTLRIDLVGLVGGKLPALFDASYGVPI
jgi:hypothetical protein